MPKVTLKHKHESFEALLRRFRKAVDKADVMKEVREREHYVKPSQKRKRAKAAAKKRWEKKRKELSRRMY
jgi:small subunit ribosomal protein S21